MRSSVVFTNIENHNALKSLNLIIGQTLKQVGSLDVEKGWVFREAQSNTETAETGKFTAIFSRKSQDQNGNPIVKLKKFTTSGPGSSEILTQQRSKAPQYKEGTTSESSWRKNIPVTTSKLLESVKTQRASDRIAIDFIESKGFKITQTIAQSDKKTMRDIYQKTESGSARIKTGSWFGSCLIDKPIEVAKATSPYLTRAFREGDAISVAASSGLKSPIPGPLMKYMR